MYRILQWNNRTDAVWVKAVSMPIIRNSSIVAASDANRKYMTRIGLVSLPQHNCTTSTNISVCPDVTRLQFWPSPLNLLTLTGTATPCSWNYVILTQAEKANNWSKENRKPKIRDNKKNGRRRNGDENLSFRTVGFALSKANGYEKYIWNAKKSTTFRMFVGSAMTENHQPTFLPSLDLTWTSSTQVQMMPTYG